MIFLFYKQAGYEMRISDWSSDVCSSDRLQLKAPMLKAQLFEWPERYYWSLRELRVESNGLQSQLVQYNDAINQRMTAKGVRVCPHLSMHERRVGYECVSTGLSRRSPCHSTKYHSLYI